MQLMISPDEAHADDRVEQIAEDTEAYYEAARARAEEEVQRKLEREAAREATPV